MNGDIHSKMFFLFSPSVCVHALHTYHTRSDPKAVWPTVSNIFFWDSLCINPYVSDGTLKKKIYIYIYRCYSNIPQNFQYHTYLHVFIIPCFWVFAHTGAPVALNGRWVSTSDWVLMRLLGFSSWVIFIWFVVNILELSRVCTYLEPLENCGNQHEHISTT